MKKPKLKKLIDREMLMRLKICPVCQRKFNLGEPVVLASGSWDGPSEWIHEEEAIFDHGRGAYIERACSPRDR